MSTEKAKTPTIKPQAAPSVPSAKPTPAPIGRVAPLFRRVDWWTFLITFAAVWIGYYLTLAPELTLEDSGELATGSFYAGIPHPPGYPVWTIYTWLWTVLLPFKNIAWRVALGEATGGALAAGLLGLLVSRGSSLLMEGIEELKAMTGRWESAICMVSGFVAGTLIGYNGFMWSQSVIVEVYSFGVASLMIVLVFLLRWIYAPHQRRYLYLALFFHGICFTNHQTLVVAAIGIEVAIAAADYRMGRNLFFWNTIVYLCGWILSAENILTALQSNHSVFILFHVVGICSAAAFFWFASLTKETFAEFSLDASILAFFVLLCAVPAIGFLGVVGALGALYGWVKFARLTNRLGGEWVVVLICGLCWVAGAAFYFYMPLAGMTNPPMQWGYPRTFDGFIHAFTRGQYEKANPSNVLGDPLHFIGQLGMLGAGIVDEFNWVYALLALLPFLFFRKLHRRERAWLIGLTAIYLCLGVLLLILLNPPPDRAAQELNRVFFTASHTIVALLVGYGLTLISAYMATHYTRFRSWGMIGGAIAVFLAILSFTQLTGDTYFGQGSSVSLSQLVSLVGQTLSNKDQYGLPVFAGLLLIGMAVVFVIGLAVYRTRAPLAITLGIFCLMPAYSILTHWSDNEQRNHWFGYWFGHDMFTPPFKDANSKPLYPEMAKDAVLYGGTDPGRFCPTYMIFCDSFLPESAQPSFDTKFDRRDVYIITQNALADGTYLNYIRAHYNRSTQIDPPFFGGVVDFLQTMCLPPDQRDARARGESVELNGSAKAVGLLNLFAKPLDRFFTALGDRIEERRRTFTSWFTPEQFTDLPAFVARLQPGPQQDPVSKFVCEQLSPETRQLLSSKGDESRLRRALASDLNRLLDRGVENRKLIARKKAEKDKLDQDIVAGDASAGARERSQKLGQEIAELSAVPPLYTPERFKDVQLSEYLQDFTRQNPQSHSRIRLDRLLLEAAYPKEIARTKGGVYPDREIYIASPEDSARCFQDYLMDAQRRLQHDMQFPNEPRQVKMGEDVRLIDNKVQVSGQVAVMSINALLTKVMFDQNPKNEFYVEESFPLDWMYPHLEPYGVIMKINRQPLRELSQEVVDRDHTFWTKYSERLIGNWINYNTSIKEIADFVDRVYMRRDYTGFKGDRKFIRDDQAQKAFSKLRSSIGGVYNYRIGVFKPGSPEQQRMIKEADFAFRQAFAFCPYSPEAVFRYVNLLLSMQRLDDALLVAQTCLKLDPYNGSVIDLVNRLQSFKRQSAMVPAQPTAESAPSVQPNLQQLEKTVAEQPTNFQAALGLALSYMHQQQTPKATQVLDRVLNSPQVDGNTVLAVAQVFAQLGDVQKLETTLEKLVKLVPDSPEAWYDLATLKVTVGKPSEALPAIERALKLSDQRHAQNTNAQDLRAQARTDTRLASLRQNPQFQQVVGSK